MVLGQMKRALSGAGLSLSVLVEGARDSRPFTNDLEGTTCDLLVACQRKTVDRLQIGDEKRRRARLRTCSNAGPFKGGPRGIEIGKEEGGPRGDDGSRQHSSAGPLSLRTLSYVRIVPGKRPFESAKGNPLLSLSLSQALCASLWNRESHRFLQVQTCVTFLRGRCLPKTDTRCPSERRAPKSGELPRTRRYSTLRPKKRKSQHRVSLCVCVCVCVCQEKV